MLDLVAELPAATRDEESNILDLGEPSARGHLISGWSADEEDGDGTYVWALGKTAAASFFAAAPTAVTVGLQCKPLVFEGAPDQTLALAVNGAPLGELSLERALAWYRFDVPADRVASGPNRLDFRFGYHRRPSDVIAGAVDQRELAVRCYAIELRGLGARAAPRAGGDGTGATLDRLELPLGTVVTYYLDQATGSELAASAMETWGPRAGDVRLLVRSRSAQVDTGTTQSVDPTAAGSPLRIPLATAGAAIDRLELAVVAGRRGDRDGWLRRKLGRTREASGLTLTHPSVRVASSRHPADTDALPRATPAGAERPDVIIYLIDTLRADHLGVYGYSRPTSPNIDRFAADAVTFDNARAQSSWTRPTVVSLLTGLAPRRHGVNRRQDALSDSVETLAELLAGAGYDTAGFVTNGNAGPDFGLDQGFEQFRYLRESAETAERHRLSDHLNLWLFDWLESRPPDARPFFLYAHATDPHVPYTPPEPFRSRFAPDVAPGIGGLEHARAVIQGRLPPTEETRRDLVDLYDAEIAFNDHHFGRLLERLKQLDLYDSSLIVLVADHGEEFLDHGGWEHGLTLFDEQLHVPLIVKLPGGRGAGRRIGASVSQVDVVPTILDLLGIPPPPALDGASLLNSTGRASFAYLALGDRRMRSITRKGWKLILDDSPLPRDGPLQLFQLAVDPKETTELTARRPFERELLAQHMRRWELELAQGAQAVGEQAEIPDELRRQLEALGYL